MGISFSEWEEMTPAQMSAYAEGYAARRDARQRRTNVDLYNLAVLIGSVTLSKHPISFDRAFPENTQPKKEMTDEQMFAMVRGLNALFGGEEV